MDDKGANYLKNSVMPGRDQVPNEFIEIMSQQNAFEGYHLRAIQRADGRILGSSRERDMRVELRRSERLHG